MIGYFATLFIVYVWLFLLSLGCRSKLNIVAGSGGFILDTNRIIGCEVRSIETKLEFILGLTSSGDSTLIDVVLHLVLVNTGGFLLRKKFQRLQLLQTSLLSIFICNVTGCYKFVLVNLSQGSCNVE
jgi:hypothetical protein